MKLINKIIDKIRDKIDKIRDKSKKKVEEETEEETEEEIPIKDEQRDLMLEQREELLTAAYILSRKYTYVELQNAANEKTAEIEGREVHGYMQRMFPNTYRWLCENYVFDYAVDFVKKYNKKEIYNVVKHYDFLNAIINVIHLPKKVSFEHFPNFEFDKFIVLTQKDVFENVVCWIENQSWMNEDGYMTTKTLAPCNFLGLGFTLWNLPVAVLKDAVGMDKLFFEATTKAENIVEIKDQILKKHIYTKRQKENTTNEKLLDMEERYTQLEKRHQYLIDDIRAGDTRNPEEKLRDFDKRYNEHLQRGDINWKKLIVGIIVFIVLIFVVMGIIALFNPPSTPEEPIDDIPETLGLLYKIYRGF